MTGSAGHQPSILISQGRIIFQFSLYFNYHYSIFFSSPLTFSGWTGRSFLTNCFTDVLPRKRVIKIRPILLDTLKTFSQLMSLKMLFAMRVTHVTPCALPYSR